MAFASAGDAERRVAGVPVAGRIVRELAESGFGAVWLAVPEGQAIGAAAMREVLRLAGALEVHTGTPPAGHEAVAVAPDRLPLSGIDLTAPDAAAAILRQTGKASDGPVSRWLNRPVSRRLSALFLLVPGFGPLQATLGTVVLAVGMVVALVAGGQTGLIAGGLLFHVTSVFDGVDGEIARATYRTSRLGATLDSLVDAGTNALFIAGVTFNLWQAGHERALALGGWGLALFVLGQATIGWLTARKEASVRFDLLKHHYRARVEGSAAALAMEFLTVVSSRDFFALLFAVLIVVGAPMAVLYIFAVAATVWIVFVAGSLFARPRPGLASDGG